MARNITTADLPPLPTKRQAAEYLSVDQRTISRYIETGLLVGVKVGPKLVRVQRDSLLALAQPMGGGRVSEDER